MKTYDAREQLVLYLYEELGEEEKTYLEERLSLDPALQKEFEELKEVKEEVETLWLEPCKKVTDYLLAYSRAYGHKNALVGKKEFVEKEEDLERKNN